MAHRQTKGQTSLDAWPNLFVILICGFIGVGFLLDITGDVFRRQSALFHPLLIQFLLPSFFEIICHRILYPGYLPNIISGNHITVLYTLPSVVLIAIIEFDIPGNNG